MGITVNGFGRQLGILRSIWQAVHKMLLAFVMHLNFMAFGPAGAALGGFLFARFYGAIDSLLEAEIILNSDFESAMNGAPSATSIGDILSYANYYFPLDTLGHLACLYASLWVAVASVKYAQKMVKFITDFKSAIKA